MQEEYNYRSMKGETLSDTFPENNEMLGQIAHPDV